MKTRRVGWLATAVMAAGLGVSACSEPQTTEFAGRPSLLLQSDVVAGSVIVCKYSVNAPGEEFTPGASFTVSATGGNLPAGSSFFLNSVSDLEISDECATAWQATDGVTRTVTITEVPQEGVTLVRIVGFRSIGDIIWLDSPSNTISLDVSSSIGAVLFFKNQGTPDTPPPPSCNGLTPGYWKNWRNHYTESQFASLLTGTIAGSITEADEIFASFGATNKSSPTTKLAWFVLANQLTLNLVGTDLPNPDDAELDLSCTDDIGESLGDALELALAMLANPDGYTKDQILAVKDILDYIANL